MCCRSTTGATACTLTKRASHASTTRIAPLIEATLTDPAELQRVLAVMQRYREPRGVYTDAGGCIDTTRECAPLGAPGRHGPAPTHCVMVRGSMAATAPPPCRLHISSVVIPTPRRVSPTIRRRQALHTPTSRRFISSNPSINAFDPELGAAMDA